VSNIKTVVNLKSIKDFLKINYPSYSDVKNIKGGEMSAIYFFTENDVNYVLRLRKNDQNFKKEQLIYESLKNSDIPVAEILKVGQFDSNYYYCLSRKVIGQTHDKLSITKKIHCVESFISTLKKIHLFSHNFINQGTIDKNGVGKYINWNKKFIKEFAKFYNYKTRNIWDYKIAEKLLVKIDRLIKYCPTSINNLYHGDYGNDNVLINNNKVTAVLDWGDTFGVGDYIMDIAWLDFWSKEISYKDYYIKQMDKSLNIEYFEERYLFYQLYIALTTLEFYSNTEQPGSFKWLVEYITEVKKLVPITNLVYYRWLSRSRIQAELPDAENQLTLIEKILPQNIPASGNQIKNQ